MDKKKILIADDEKDLCYFVKRLLERRGYEVIIVRDPFVVEMVCRKEKPDLILLDIVMPGRRGEEILDSLRNNPQIQDIPVVIMTGLGEMVYFRRKDKWRWLPQRKIVRKRGEVIEFRDEEKAAKVYGVQDYIKKPFLKEDLYSVIERVFHRQKKKTGSKAGDEFLGVLKIDFYGSDGENIVTDCHLSRISNPSVEILHVEANMLQRALSKGTYIIHGKSNKGSRFSKEYKVVPGKIIRDKIYLE